MKRVVGWQRVDALGLEYAEIDLEPLHLEGEIVVVEGGVPCAVSYRVDCDSAGMTARAFIRMRRNGASSERTLVRSAGNQWTVDGVSATLLDGLADVDLSVTPSTNSLPLRRLRLNVGQRAEVMAAWVRLPSLDVVPLRQSYRRTGSFTYEYEAPELNFAAELECDEEGIVKTYGGLWTRFA